jgi:hypothetical protein
VFVEYNKNNSNTMDPKTLVTNTETALFNIPVELRVAVTIPVAFVFSSLFIARLNASHKEIITHGKGVKQEGTEGVFGPMMEEVTGDAR